MDEAKKLYEDFLAGSDEAFEDLVKMLGDPLLLFINSYVRDYHLAEDLMEDCFVDLLVKKPKFRGHARFKSFLFQMGKFKALNYLKRKNLFRWFSTDSENAPTLKDEPRILEGLIKNEASRALYQAMNSLPADYRQAIYLVYFEDLSYEETARVMGKNKKQVDNLLYRAKGKLAGLLEEVNAYEKQ